jgi:periplasmic copper chaperone A
MRLWHNRRMNFKHIICVALFALATGVCAQDFKLGHITINRPYAKATVTGQPVAGGYLKLTNRGRADRLLSATSPVAKSIALHAMSMQGDVMQMREVPAIYLPKGKTIQLKPGDLHLMFMGLQAPLKVGDSFPLKLKFEQAGEIEVTVKVQPVQP